MICFTQKVDFKYNRRGASDMKIENPEGFSLFGEPLYNPVSYPDPENKQLVKFNQAVSEWENEPECLEKIIWLGRQHAYMGRYRNAIHIYTEALKHFPGNPELLRHRAHRYLSLRLFKQCIIDSEKAVDGMLLKPDHIEPSGLAGAEEVTQYTLYTNTYYHLGLAYMLKGDMLNARRAFNNLLDAATNDDHIIMACYWLYIILKRLGRETEAGKILERVKPEMETMVSQEYYYILKLFKGEFTIEDIQKKSDEKGQLGVVTYGYGLANAYLFNGDYNKYIETLKRILATNAWSGFGYISAEVDVYNLGYILS
jgi:tetratricopeptide (TPR) repeat protein